MSDTAHNKWKALAVLGIAYLMVVLDVSIVNVALSAVAEDLTFNPADLQWIVSGYALTFGGFLLLGGRMGDILGRRRIFVAGLIVFAIFSLVCGLATSPALLITSRILQGAGAALLSPSVFSIVSVTFDEGAERNKALGVLGAIAGSGAAIGVLLGGVLTEYASWRWCFLINVPIAIVALFLVPKFVQESRTEGKSRHFDALGAVLVTSSLMMLVYALTQANNKGWDSGQTVGFLIGSGVLMAAFLWVEHRGKAPLVPLGFFRNRTASGANVIGFGLGTVVFGMFLLLSLYMPYVLGYSTLKTGLAYLAVALTAVVASGAAQALVTRISIKVALVIGMGLLGLGLLTFTQLPVIGSYPKHLLPGFLLIGVGLGFSFVPVSIAALAGVKPHEAGLASGLINTSQQIGGALGVAVLSTVAASVTGTVPPFPPFTDAQKASLTDGYTGAFGVALIFVAVSLLAIFTMLRGKDLGEAATHGAAPVG
jgi:EmrB/QacA subfamily drug resistance transporter